MKTVDKIPTSKISRTGKFLKTGAKIGVNYINYYKDKWTGNTEEAKQKLNENNAEDIYQSLSQMKGSALKVAQMLSMEKNILPSEYVEKFSLSQFSVPPLSAPLVQKTFKKYFGKNPNNLFDEFALNASFAASIGQVHKAKLNQKELAVKIQYPGVAESISSDLAMVKSIAVKMFNLKGKDKEKYFKEVEGKLIEETDYELEVQQSQEIAKACAAIPHLKFPRFYPELSSPRIITMDWMHGKHLSEFIQENPSEKQRQQIGQALWDFYMFQIHILKKVHADPHPGNFLVNRAINLIALDFGCVKHIPNDFYTPYFDLIQPEKINNQTYFLKKMRELEIIRPDDSPQEITFFIETFHRMITLFTRPFNQEYFDFSDESFFDEIYKLGENFSKASQARKANGNRGSRHFIYMNRTFFGLYSLLSALKPKKIKINQYKSYQ
ncbi:AarF/ABC1/UbiB kinase family protein [Ornithobacterium rhinotracheale]|uniref:ABC1 kinase family protein n=1 Tax=Ornithobacterium rhinotracheale TaxID=28251 RepID=UPI00129CAB90|nr:AarF/ABC1/UbiB kinase family protein [Ornithobacterium rhinotracheale]MRJ10463.1 AarF/ABC1/UbiB kinase family protein [Ornithobacterium rhinotracheale]